MLAETTPSYTALTASLPVSVHSETGRLRQVIIGYADNFDLAHAEIINETQKQYYFGQNAPQLEALKDQVAQLVACLEAQGVEVFRPRPLPNVPDQIMTRDIGVTIGNCFVVSRMAYHSRQNEWQGITHLLDQIPHVLFVPEPAVIEGGDIVVDKGRILVGLSQRTNAAGVQWLTQQFPEYEVVPVPLKQIEDGENVLHLDCAFVPVGENHALIYPAGFREIPAVLSQNYHFIEVTRAEQDGLGTNVLSISPTQVISRHRATRINQELEKIGLQVLPLVFDEAPKTGGSFRCASLPLWRE